MHEVILAPRAGLDLDRLSRDTALRVARKLRIMAADPSPRGDPIKRLHGFTQPRYRLRIGDYRAIFATERNRVVVFRIIHRSELDRALRDLLA